MKNGYVPRLKARYLEEVASELQKEFEYSSAMQIPRIEKVSVSVGVGEAISNKKLLALLSARNSGVRTVSAPAGGSVFFIGQSLLQKDDYRLYTVGFESHD